MSILKQILSILVVLDSKYLYLASIPATIKHAKLVKQAFTLYLHRFGRKLNWKNPTRFSEKMHLFKMSVKAEQVTQFADKYQVREYVTKTIGKEYLIPLLGVYASPTEINLYKLPNSFVLKCTHGSNWNVICADKAKMDWDAQKEKLTTWLSSSFYEHFAERQYRKMQPRIVCEEYIGNSEGLTDYKFHCFAGKPAFVRVMVGRSTEIKKSSYTLDWQLAPCNYLNSRDGKPAPAAIVAKPKNFEQMIAIVEKLAAPFPYVRVDLYNVDGKIYFGELTFTPNAGLDIHSPDRYDETYGKLFQLSF